MLPIKNLSEKSDKIHILKANSVNDELYTISLTKKERKKFIRPIPYRVLCVLYSIMELTK